MCILDSLRGSTLNVFFCCFSFVAFLFFLLQIFEVSCDARHSQVNQRNISESSAFATLIFNAENSP